MYLLIKDATPEEETVTIRHLMGLGYTVKKGRRFLRREESRPTYKREAEVKALLGNDGMPYHLFNEQFDQARYAIERMGLVVANGMVHLPGRDKTFLETTKALSAIMKAHKETNKWNVIRTLIQQGHDRALIEMAARKLRLETESRGTGGRETYWILPDT